MFSCQNKNSLNLTAYPYESSPELESIVKKFEKIYNAKIDFTITFVKDSELNSKPNAIHIAGVCQRITGHGPDKKQILISKEWWSGQIDYPAFKELLVFHELGHCYFLRDHDDTILSDGYPKSIMKSTMDQFLYVYSWFYDYYLTELSSGANLAVLNPNNPTGTETLKLVEDSMSIDGKCIKSQ